MGAVLTAEEGRQLLRGREHEREVLCEEKGERSSKAELLSAPISVEFQCCEEWGVDKLYLEGAPTGSER